MTDPQDRVLVAIMNNPLDLAIAQSQGWYRIPVGATQVFCCVSGGSGFDLQPNQAATSQTAFTPVKDVMFYAS